MSQRLGHTKRSAHSPNHFRPFDDSFRPAQKIFDRIRPFSSWAGNKMGSFLTHKGHGGFGNLLDILQF
jgi:hypothetical protein